MPLDPQALALRNRNAEAGSTPLYELTVEEARHVDLAAIQADSAIPEPVAEVVDTKIPGPAGPLPARIYRPVGDGPLPVLLYLFGGGWTLGCLDTADGICRGLANAAGCVVVSVEYRLAPENKFPAAVEDSYSAFTWIAEHAAEFDGDPTRLAVGGDSAGGNLAAATTLLARDRNGPPLAFQLLVYPNTDYLADTESLRANTDRYLFNSRSVAWYWDNYLAKPADGSNPLASPLRAESLSGLPRALVITAEYCPLRDEGEQYGQRLADAGVPVTVTRYDGVMHGFFAMTRALDAGKRAMAQAATELRAAWEGGL
jgi:acetyl esterase